MISTKTDRVRCRQNLVTDIDLAAGDADSGMQFAESLFYEPAFEPLELGGRNVFLMDGHRIEGFEFLSVEEVYA